MPPDWYRDPYDAQQRRYWDGTRWTGAFARLEAPLEPPVAVQERRYPYALGLIIGGTALIVGSLLPWAHLTAPAGTLSAAGTDFGSDGWVTVSLGLALVVVVGVRLCRRGSLQVVTRIGGLVAATASVMVVVEIAILVYRFGEFRSQFTSGSTIGQRPLVRVSTSVGSGLFVCGAGALTALASSLVDWKSATRPPPGGAREPGVNAEG